MFRTNTDPTEMEFQDFSDTVQMTQAAVQLHLADRPSEIKPLIDYVTHTINVHPDVVKIAIMRLELYGKVVWKAPKLHLPFEV